MLSILDGIRKSRTPRSIGTRKSKIYGKMDQENRGYIVKFKYGTTKGFGTMVTIVRFRPVGTVSKLAKGLKYGTIDFYYHKTGIC